MFQLSQHDANFRVDTHVNKDRLIACDVCRAPFSLHGIFPPNADTDRFHRLPKAVAEAVSPGVASLYTNTAGGRVRFATNSGRIAIHAELGAIPHMPHMPLTGSSGFDLYRSDGGVETHVHTFVPPFRLYEDEAFDSRWDTDTRDMHSYTLNFPLYTDVKRLYILLDEDAALQESAPYPITAPVVFYGSSITQGGCASRPGNAYESILSRRYGFDYWNLGFSGGARGEAAMAQYIAGLPMGAFVLDYDHNAPDPSHLERTHEAFFKTIRAANPDLPILCVSRNSPKPDLEARRAIILKTVENARKAGDRKVWFVDGARFGEELGMDAGMTVDGTHPNDLGFWSMANHIGACLSRIL